MNEKGERLMFGLFHKRTESAGTGSAGKRAGSTASGGERSHVRRGDSRKGVAVRPTDGRIYAPADGEITLLFDTLHALSMTTDTGAELLLHIDWTPLSLKGAHFKAHVKTGIKSERVICCWRRILMRSGKPDMM